MPPNPCAGSGRRSPTQGGLLNVAQFARNLGVDVKTAGSYIDLLVDLLLARRQPPWRANLGKKRLVKTPDIYVRDSGIVHALLNITDQETLLTHPVIGQSRECFVIENLLLASPEGTQAHFYRTSGGAEIDSLLHLPAGECWAIEIKRSPQPRVERGFHAACEDLSPPRRHLIHPGQESCPLAHGIEAVPLDTLARRLTEHA